MQILNYILLSYPLSIITFFLISIISKEAKNRTNGFLNAANLLIMLIVFTIFSIIIIDINWRGNRWESCLSEANPEAMAGYFIGIRLYYIILTAIFLFQLLFLWKKNRVKGWITLLSMLLVMILVFFETLIAAIINLYRDYIPSDWEHEAAMTYRVLILFAVLNFLICWIAAGFRSRHQNPNA